MIAIRHCPVCEAEGFFYKKLGEYRLYRCASCESFFYHPSPVAHGIEETPWGSAKWYVERGANLQFYAEVLDHIRNLVDNLPRKKKGETVDMLEVGGSYGFMMDMASVLLGWDVSGVDPGACAQQGGRELGREILDSRIEEARFERQFDVIAGVQLIEHIHEPRAFLNSLSRLVKEHGIVILTTPDISAGDLGAEYSPGEHHILFSKKELTALLKEAGFISHNFFPTSLPTIMGVVAAKTPLPATTSASDKESPEPKQMTLEYLTKKIQSGSHARSLGTGLNFRLFELLVNGGRYAEADACLRKLETLMGAGERESCDAFILRLFGAMSSAATAADYVAAGPGCFAPYLFYKGILNLNHKKNRGAARECFSYAARLFRKEVQELDLIQFAPFLEAANRHVEIAGGESQDSKDNLHNRERTMRAAPFIKGGVAEFCESVPVGRLSRLRLKGGSSFIFTFVSMEDDLSAVAFDLLIRPHDKTTRAEITLHIFEEYNPVSLRKTSLVIDSGTQRFIEPFCFEPIKDSRGKTYSLVLSPGSEVQAAGLLCSNLKGKHTIAGHRRYRNIQPVIVPYNSVNATLWKRFPAEGSPLVSCLIVTYNSEGYIRHCLTSIASQDYPNIEVVVVDNHSDDLTAETIRKEFGGVNLFVMEQNLEFCKGNNFGISKCKGNFVCVLNADVVLERGAIRRFVERIEISPHVGIVGSTIETKGSITRYADTFLVDGLIVNDESLLSGIRFSSAACGAGFMVRKSVISKIGYLFDEDYVSNWEDHDLGLRCWLHGYVVLHIPELGLYHYGGSAHGLADPRRESQIFRNMLLTYFKNFGKRLFLKAFIKSIRSCAGPYGLLGIVRFLGCFWKYIPKKSALQRERKIDDSALQVIASGISAIIPEDKKGTVPELRAQP